MLSLRAAVRTMKPYVPGKSIEEVQREFGVKDLVKLNQNENPLGPSPLALAAVRDALSHMHTYPEGSSRALRERLAQLWNLPPDWFIVGNGSDEIFRLLAETYLEPGDRVVVPAPSFAGYPLVAELMGATVIQVPLIDHRMNLPAMARAAIENGARLLFLCRPNNPTGTVFTEEAMRGFLERLPARICVVLDEAYREFDETPFDSRQLLLEHPNLIITRTFSKIYGMAGIRLGYGVGRPEWLAPFYTVRDPFSVNNLAAAAGLMALDDHQHLRRTLELVKGGKAFLYAAFERAGARYTASEANFVLFETAQPAVEIYQAMLRQGVLIRPCGSFGLPYALRVTVGTAEENERFVAALNAILTELPQIRP